MLSQSLASLPVAARRLNTQPIIKTRKAENLQAFQSFTSNCVAKIFHLFQKQVEISSFLRVAEYYKFRTCMMVPIMEWFQVTTQTRGVWKLFELPASVCTSVRKSAIPLLQSREIYTGIGGTAMPNRVHKVIIQILALKVCISSQKPTAKRFHKDFYYDSCYACGFILWSLAVLNNTLFFGSQSFTQQWMFKELFSFLYELCHSQRRRVGWYINTVCITPADSLDLK